MAGQMNLDIEYEEKKVYRDREVKLSQSEAADLGIGVGRLAGEIETAKKAAKDAESQQDEFISKLKKNSAMKTVECIMKLYYNNRTVQVFDGEEMIEERAMTDSEFQMEFGPTQHGVVLPPEEPETAPSTPEEAAQDLQDTMKAEKNPNKPSLVDMR